MPFLIIFTFSLKIRNSVNKKSEEPTMVSFGTIKDGCSSLTKCNPNSCPRNAECIERWDDVECRCLKGRFGSKCLPACSVNQCQNGGKCIPDNTRESGFKCECPIEFTGSLCEREASCPIGWSGTIPGKLLIPCHWFYLWLKWLGYISPSKGYFYAWSMNVDPFFSHSVFHSPHTYSQLY